MTISLSGVHVTVDDPDTALVFYRDTLGMAVRNEVANDGYRWITLVTDTQPEIQIVLSQPHAGRSQEDGDALAALLAKGALPMIQVRSDDLDATFDKIAAAPGSRGAAGARQPVLGSPRLRRARSRGQHGPRRAGVGPDRHLSVTGFGPVLRVVRHCG
jgi:catechol 2,3-dioxygenase-like lactoylglutathione lyase family enzyme